MSNYYALPDHTAGIVTEGLNGVLGMKADTDSSRIVRVDFPEDFNQPLRKEMMWKISGDIQASGMGFTWEEAAKYL